MSSHTKVQTQTPPDPCSIRFMALTAPVKWLFGTHRIHADFLYFNTDSITRTEILRPGPICGLECSCQTAWYLWQLETLSQLVVCHFQRQPTLFHAVVGLVPASLSPPTWSMPFPTHLDQFEHVSSDAFLEIDNCQYHRHLHSPKICFSLV